MQRIINYLKSHFGMSEQEAYAEIVSMKSEMLCGEPPIDVIVWYGLDEELLSDLLDCFCSC